MNSVCVLSKYSTFSTSLPSSSAHDVLRSTCLPVRSIFVFRGRASGAAPPGPATPLMPDDFAGEEYEYPAAVMGYALEELDFLDNGL